MPPCSQSERLIAPESTACLHCEIRPRYEREVRWGGWRSTRAASYAYARTSSSDQPILVRLRKVRALHPLHPNIRCLHQPPLRRALGRISPPFELVPIRFFADAVIRGQLRCRVDSEIDEDDDKLPELDAGACSGPLPPHAGAEAPPSPAIGMPPPPPCAPPAPSTTTSLRKTLSAMRLYPMPLALLSPAQMKTRGADLGTWLPAIPRRPQGPHSAGCRDEDGSKSCRPAGNLLRICCKAAI